MLSWLLMLVLWAQAPAQPQAPTPPGQAAMPGAQSSTEALAPGGERAARVEKIKQDCARLLGGDVSLAPMQPLCNSALSYTFTLPDFICDEHIERHASLSSSGFLPPPDVITTQVTFQQGTEHYSNIAVNGNPVRGTLLDLRGMDSVGEFGTLVAGVFKARQATRFAFRKEEKLGGAPALVFEFHVSAENNHMWHWVEEGKEVAPAIGGQLWIEKSSGLLRRFLIHKESGGPKTETDQASITIDYGDVQLGEAGQFRLPHRSEVIACAVRGRCNRNLLRFSNCHKFHATGRILIEPEK